MSSKTRSSRRATLIRAESKRNLAELAEEQALKADAAAAAATSDTKKPKVAKDAPVVDVDMSPKPKAKGRSAKAKAKAAAKSTPGKKETKVNKGKAEGGAKKGRQPKDYVPCSDAIQKASQEALGPYGKCSLQNIRADMGEDLVSRPSSIR